MAEGVIMLDLIARHREKIIEEVRSYVRSQKELWQRIPWLLLQNEGLKKGVPGLAFHDWEFGYWTARSSRDYYFGHDDLHYCTVFVGLATGELVARDVRHPATDEDVCHLAFHLGELDAQAIIDKATAAILGGEEYEICQSSPAHMRDFGGWSGYRAYLAKNFSITERYARPATFNLNSYYNAGSPNNVYIEGYMYTHDDD